MGPNETNLKLLNWGFDMSRYACTDNTDNNDNDNDFWMNLKYIYIVIMMRISRGVKTKNMNLRN